MTITKKELLIKHPYDEKYKILSDWKFCIENLVIDGLRERPHTTHFNFDDALKFVAKTTAKNVWLTHVTHDFTHEQMRALFLQKKETLGLPLLLNRKIEPAYDGLVIDVK